MTANMSSNQGEKLSLYPDEGTISSCKKAPVFMKNTNIFKLAAHHNHYGRGSPDS